MKTLKIGQVVKISMQIVLVQTAVIKTVILDFQQIAKSLTKWQQLNKKWFNKKLKIKWIKR